MIYFPSEKNNTFIFIVDFPYFSIFSHIFSIGCHIGCPFQPRGFSNVPRNRCRQVDRNSPMAGALTPTLNPDDPAIWDQYNAEIKRRGDVANVGAHVGECGPGLRDLLKRD